MRYIKLFEMFNIDDRKEEVEDYLLELSEDYKLDIRILPCITKGGVFFSHDVKILHSPSSKGIPSKLGMLVSITRKSTNSLKELSSIDILSIIDKFKTFQSRVIDKYIVDIKSFNITKRSVEISVALTPKEEIFIEIDPIQTIYNKFKKGYRDFFTSDSRPYGTGREQIDFIILNRFARNIPNRFVMGQYGMERAPVKLEKSLLDLMDKKVFKEMLKIDGISVEAMTESEVIKFLDEKKNEHYSKIKLYVASKASDMKNNIREYLAKINQNTLSDTSKKKKKIETFKNPNKLFFVVSKISNLTKESMWIQTFNKFNESKKNSNFKRFLIDDFIIYQGKNAEGNDYVTVEIADQEDYWFHAKGFPGSHVIIKIRDKIPTESTIRKVAMIAAKNCKCDKSEVNVVYCKKKFVTKKNGMNPGQVSVDYKNSYEIVVEKI